MDANGDGEVDSQDFLLDESSVVFFQVREKFASRLRLVFQEFSLFFLSMDREILDEVSGWKTMEVNVFWIKMTRCVGCVADHVSQASAKQQLPEEILQKVAKPAGHPGIFKGSLL